jgi:D-glycero-beta-D-manno-heptose-7-phosphate kinase
MMIAITADLNSNPFENVKVAVLGDVMMDRFIYGDVERISPEAPIPVVRVTKRNSHLGGAGNVAANLTALGAKPIMIGRIGDDELGREFETMANTMNMETKYLLKTEVPTISKTRVIARSQQVVRFDEEVTDSLSSHDRTRVLTVLEQARKETSTLIISDYSKGMVDDKMLEDVKKVWRSGDIFIDPKPKGEARNIAYIGTTTMTPNAQEASELLSFPKPKTDEEAEKMAAELVEKFNLNYVLLTRSGDGMTLYVEGKAHHLKAKVQEVIDVSGAGDTVISVFAVAVASGMSVEEAAHFANVSGGVVVAKLGTATASWPEMQKAMRKYLEFHSNQAA